MTTKAKFPSVYNYKGSQRDRVLVNVVNWLLNTFATERYLKFIYVVMDEGRKGLDKRLAEMEDEASDRETE